MDDIEGREGSSSTPVFDSNRGLEIHGCMEEKMGEHVWVVTNWDGEFLCRCSDEGVARRIARALNQHG